MRRLVLIAVVLAAPVSLAHVFVFDFVLNRSVGNYADDAGVMTLQWVDMESPGGAAYARFFMARHALSPFAAPDANDVLQVSGEIPLSNAINLFEWDTADAGEGCWHPYALIRDPIEGDQLAFAQGELTVVRGSNVPPSIWVSTPLTAQPDDAGRLALTFEVDEPDDPSLLGVEWEAVDGERGTLAQNLPLSSGTRSASYTIDTHRLPHKAIFFKVSVRSSDAGYCDAWWRGYVNGDLLPVDGGTTPDAGPAIDAGGADAGGHPGQGSCGCVSSPSWGAVSVMTAALAMARRSRRARSCP